MAAPRVDPLEKSVNSAEIPSTSEALNLWETEKIDHSVLNYYHEQKSPNAQLSQKPQTCIFSRGHATLHLAVSVGPSVRRSHF